MNKHNSYQHNNSEYNTKFTSDLTSHLERSGGLLQSFGDSVNMQHQMQLQYLRRRNTAMDIPSNKNNNIIHPQNKMLNDRKREDNMIVKDKENKYYISTHNNQIQGIPSNFTDTSKRELLGDITQKVKLKQSELGLQRMLNVNEYQVPWKKDPSCKSMKESKPGNVNKYLSKSELNTGITLADSSFKHESLQRQDESNIVLKNNSYCSSIYSSSNVINDGSELIQLDKKEHRPESTQELLDIPKTQNQEKFKELYIQGSMENEQLKKRNKQLEEDNEHLRFRVSLLLQTNSGSQQKINISANSIGVTQNNAQQLIFKDQQINNLNVENTNLKQDIQILKQSEIDLKMENQNLKRELEECVWLLEESRRKIELINGQIEGKEIQYNNSMKKLQDKILILQRDLQEKEEKVKQFTVKQHQQQKQHTQKLKKESDGKDLNEGSFMQMMLLQATTIEHLLDKNKNQSNNNNCQG